MERRMTTEKTCPKCESARWMTGVEFQGPFPLKLFATPATWIKEARGVTSFTANMCADCGFTEMYATHPLKVWDEWHVKNR
jgi:predicted nucleic-acid-binding Zn-ribbon protein